jgi:Na+/H+ antiporter NhaD/arsenite permease-like protein
MLIVTIVFAVVYLGMMLGTLPGLKMDRASIALGGAMALLAFGEVTQQAALASIDFGTIGMLFGLMLISIQLERAGVYGVLSAAVTRVRAGPAVLLAMVVALVGALAALLTNDVVAVAMTPTVLAICLRRGINPVPFLLAIAFAANAGAVATIIGSPQNMLIAERLDLSFGHFLAYALVPALLSLVVVWGALVVLYRNRWALSATRRIASEPAAAEPVLDRWEAAKGVLILGVVLYAFIFTDWGRGLVAASAGVLMLFNARFVSRSMLHKVDWDLLILFIGLFIVNGAMQNTALPGDFVAELGRLGFDLRDSDVLFLATAVLSDLTSNVPAVMLLLPYATGPEAGPLMALASGLSSNLIIVGSLANIIVVDAASQRGLTISFKEFALAGVPVALITLAVGWAWVALVFQAG